jgi:Metallo-beta-lactamase superfamily
VLDVGDGACSVLRECSEGNDACDQTAVVDCGCSPGRAALAANILAQDLSSEDWRSLSELVVTHFDADHWEGLLRVADSAPVGSGDLPRDLRIFYPAVPFDVNLRLPAGIMALITAKGPFGVQALDLRAAWLRLTGVQLVPLARDDNFSLAGRLHEVVWPPRQLKEGATQRLNRLVQEIEDQAERLADNGYPQLQVSLREAYENGPFNRHPRREERTNDPADLMRAGLEAWQGDAEPQAFLLEGAINSAIPPDWARKPDFKNLVRRARAAQNDLSLIFHDAVQGSLLVFGDAPPHIVERVHNDLRSDGYQVGLAPHHGSQRLLNSAPCAGTCVSQGGRLRWRHWQNHTSTHLNCGDCLNTFDSGDVVRRMR